MNRDLEALVHNRFDILNIGVDPVDEEQALEIVNRFLRLSDRPHSIFAVNPEKAFSVPKDPLLHQTFQTADLLIPDGIGIVLAVRLLYGIRLSRVPGIELMEKICALAAKEGYRIFIYGANERVNKAAVKILEDRYPGIKIVGRMNGYLREEEMAGLVSSINESGAEILFLALGSPKQEKWFATYKHFLTNVKVCQGVGGTLDTIAGEVKRAPRIWQRCAAEWLYRLISDPKRIKRQKVLPPFVAMVLLIKLKSFLKARENKQCKCP